MAVSKKVLGMNARNFLYIRQYNSASAKRIADDKLETKRVLLEHDLPTPDLIATLEDRGAIRKFNWSVLPENGFVIKPARGYGGAGILPIKKWGVTGISTSGEEYNIKQLESHLFDIIEGAYSLQYLPDKAFIEERVVLHPFFRKLTPIGIPDIRVIVFHKVPVMAMLRLPTRESGGRANLHMGGIGIGIDIRTGITTHAIHFGKPVKNLPDTKVKARGIKIPNWEEILLIATTAQEACGLGYAGIDIVIDSKKGPLVLEVNARPGLSIQNANNTSLRTRLERVQDISIPTPERGVEVAKSLFAEAFSEKVKTIPKVLKVIEKVTLHGKDSRTHDVYAKVDTGAFRTSIDHSLAQELGLEEHHEKVFIKSASGERERDTVKLTFEIGGKKITTIASVIDRSHLMYPMIVGRRDIQGFYIDPQFSQQEAEQIELEGKLTQAIM